MIRRSFRFLVIYALEAIAVLFAVTLFAGGALIWRLSQGPMELDFLLADAQSRLAEAFEGDLVSLTSLEARFDTDSGLLIIAARDVTVAETGGNLITRAPLIEAGFGLDALLIGQIAPSSVTIEGGAVSIVRRADGAVGAGLGSPTRVAEDARPAGSDRNVDAVLELLRNPDDNALLGRLTRVSIHSASVRVVDEVNELDWYIDQAELRLDRDTTRLQAELSGRFATTAGFAPVAMRLEAGADLNTFLFEARAENLSPRAIAPLFGPFARAGDINAPISVEMFASASRSEGIRAASLNLNVGAGQLGRGPSAQAIRGLTAIIEYEPIDGAIRINELNIDADRLTTRMTGRIFDMREFDDTFPRRWNYDLSIGPGRLDLGGFFEAPPEWAGVELSGQMNARNIEISFERLDAEIGPITARLIGLARLRQVEDGSWLPDIQLTGPVEGDVPPDLVLRYWPVELADGARRWIEESIISARVFDAHLELDLNAEALVEKRLADERMTLTFGFEDAAFRYISTMTPMTRARGRATLFGNSFVLNLDRGFIGETPVRNGYVDIPYLNPRGALATFGGEATAGAQAVLALIDEPPLNLVSSYGLDPQAITGQGDVQFEIQRPMLEDVPVEDIGFDIRAEFADVSMDTGIRDLVLSNGDVLVTATPQALEISGTAELAGTEARIRWVESLGLPDGEPSTALEMDARLDPVTLDRLGIPLRRYLEGSIEVRLQTLGEAFAFDTVTMAADLRAARVEWPGGLFIKPDGELALAEAELRFDDTGTVNIERFQMEAEGLSATASAQFGNDGRLLAADVSRLFLDGFVDAAGSATRPQGPDGPLAFILTGPFFNATDLLPGLTDFSGAGGAPPPLGLSVVFDAVQVTDATRYNDVRLDWQSDAAEGELLTVRANTPAGDFALDLASEIGGRREIALNTADFGEFLRLLDLYDNVAGGTLSVTGSTPPPGTQGRTEFHIESGAFNLIRMPVLARVLAAGSLPGLAALLSGNEGISFDVLQADIVIEDGNINISEARANGPSLGVTTEGTINMVEDRLALDGVLAPSYGLNSFVGNLPLVGEVLVSRPGEGVIGITFSAEGPFDQPTVIANPLSVLAPGLLRRLFEGSAADRERARQAEEDNIENAAPVETLPEAMPESEPAIQPDAGDGEPEITLEPQGDAADETTDDGPDN